MPEKVFVEDYGGVLLMDDIGVSYPQMPEKAFVKEDGAILLMEGACISPDATSCCRLCSPS